MILPISVLVDASKACKIVSEELAGIASELTRTQLRGEKGGVAICSGRRRRKYEL